MDEVFDRANFRNEIVWKRTAAHSDAHTWSQVTDSILFYTKSSEFTWNPRMSHTTKTTLLRSIGTSMVKGVGFA